MIEPLSRNSVKTIYFLSANLSVSTKDGFSYLSLDNVNEDDVGNYEAIASNSVGQVMAKFICIVDEGPEEHFPPRFMSSLDNQELKPNMNLLLHTKISASPYVAINW